MPNQFWWPDQLDLSPLRQHGAESNPLGEDFDYAKAFASLDLNAVKQDIKKVLTTSQALVAGRLRQLRTVLHPDGLAQRRHLPCD